MDIPDYIPDVEVGGEESAPSNATPVMSVDKLRDAWASQWTSPAKLIDIRDWMVGVQNFTGQLVDTVADKQGRYPGKDTPAERSFLESLEKLKTAVDGVNALVDHGYGGVTWLANEKRYQVIKQVGLDVFTATNRWIKSKPETLANKIGVPGSQDEWKFWKGALGVTLGIVAISTFADLVKSIRGRD
jgi:hypothetical protein